MSYIEFDTYLDATNPQVEIGDEQYSPAHVLKTIDPASYERQYQEFLSSFSTD